MVDMNEAVDPTLDAGVSCVTIAREARHVSAEGTIGLAQPTPDHISIG
jgi:hypothetical protein